MSAPAEGFQPIGVPTPSKRQVAQWFILMKPPLRPLPLYKTEGFINPLALRVGWLSRFIESKTLSDVRGWIGGCMG